ncbi:HIT family protein [Longimicrobium sp.]|jgi:diadenosine tetraphosphate (Ap4A) HIT family hydrolase|uniref:HIT family protein n=1 Tax=Longimicrobium sp. TaxID=2029185 RepID=UPI002ED813AB
MSRWGDPEEWARLVTSEGCPICTGGGPTHIIAELEVSWLTMGDDPGPLPGSCALFLRRHAVELHELEPDEGCAYMRDIQRVSRAVKEATGAVKMNYEIHGNTIPHLHTHFFPRYPGDAFEGRPIDPRQPPHTTVITGHAALKRRIISALQGY